LDKNPDVINSNWAISESRISILDARRVSSIQYRVSIGNQWLSAPAEPSADIAPESGDGVVDFLDLALVAEHWLEHTTL